MFKLGLESCGSRRTARIEKTLSIAKMIALSVAIALAAAVAVPSSTRGDERESAAKLIARTVGNPEFRVKTFRGGTWLGSGDAYLAIEPAAAGGGSDIVRYQTATGARDILIAASRLIPAGEKAPLAVEDYAMSSDGRQVLVFTNSKTVWRQNTRGDYWVLDLKSGALRKLGGDAPASSLMFAKFSPDNSRVGYVSGNNVYVEELASGKITQLTRDGSDTIINGTSDWVNEEEFNIRDGFEWSPDSRSIAFWQFDASGVKNYTLIYDLAARRNCDRNSLSKYRPVSADASVSVSACWNAELSGSRWRRKRCRWTSRLVADDWRSAQFLYSSDGLGGFRSRFAATHEPVAEQE